MFGIIRLLMYFVIVIALTCTFIVMMRNMSKIKRAWRIAEGDIRKMVEEETGQRIRDEVSLNCSLTGDFNNDASVIWFAFTADKMGLVVNESLLDPAGLDMMIYDKAGVSLKRERFRIFEMQIDLQDGEDKQIIYMGIPKKKMEIIKHHIRKIEQ